MLNAQRTPVDLQMESPQVTGDSANVREVQSGVPYRHSNVHGHPFGCRKVPVLQTVADYGCGGAVVLLAVESIEGTVHVDTAQYPAPARRPAARWPWRGRPRPRARAASGGAATGAAPPRRAGGAVRSAPPRVHRCSSSAASAARENSPRMPSRTSPGRSLPRILAPGAELTRTSWPTGRSVARSWVST